MSAYFYLPFSDDHKEELRCIQRAILDGELYAFADPRGDGKTTRVIGAVLWAILYGHRRFVALIGSDQGHAQSMLESIKSELENNDVLLEDFPEVCHPIRCLEGLAIRCGGQLLDGRRTAIVWKQETIVLPSVDGSAASGVRLTCCGITGSIRGMQYRASDGSIARPDLFALDDPQTDESAHSPAQCAMRERVLTHTIMQLAGPDKKLAGFMPCTVIAENDMADRILNRKLNPQWHGTIHKLLYSFPKNMELWQKYADIRADSLREGKQGEEATEFYRQNRAAMDEGARVGWEHRKKEGQLSALQFAMNIFFENESVFWAEFQNEPRSEVKSAAEPVHRDCVQKHNGLARGVLPNWATLLTAFVDIQKPYLPWMVCAWGQDFQGALIDYGTFPDQNRTYYTKANATHTITKEHRGMSMEAAIYATLQSAMQGICGREWPTESGGVMRVGLVMVDANWGDITNTVYSFCRASPFASILLPSHGKFIGASSVPFSQYRARPGERLGTHWRISIVPGRRATRFIVFDANWWKSFIRSRLNAPIGTKGGFEFCLGDHRLLADHLQAEFPVEVTARNVTVEEWKWKPGRPDNDFFDCLVGCAVAASVLGAEPVSSWARNQPATSRSALLPSQSVGTMTPVQLHRTVRTMRQRVRYMKA